jgi:hypothetical protein
MKSYHLLREIWQHRRRDQQRVYRLDTFKLCDSLCGIELGRPEFYGFIPLGFSSREYHCFKAHLGCKLDGQVAEPANANNANSITCFEGVFVQGTPDGCFRPLVSDAVF